MFCEACPVCMFSCCCYTYERQYSQLYSITILYWLQHLVWTNNLKFILYCQANWIGGYFTIGWLSIVVIRWRHSLAKPLHEMMMRSREEEYIIIHIGVYRTDLEEHNRTRSRINQYIATDYGTFQQCRPSPTTYITSCNQLLLINSATYIYAHQDQFDIVVTM